MTVDRCSDTGRVNDVGKKQTKARVLLRYRFHELTAHKVSKRPPSLWAVCAQLATSLAVPKKQELHQLKHSFGGAAITPGLRSNSLVGEQLPNSLAAEHHLYGP